MSSNLHTSLLGSSSKSCVRFTDSSPNLDKIIVEHGGVQQPSPEKELIILLATSIPPTESIEIIVETGFPKKAFVFSKGVQTSINL